MYLPLDGGAWQKHCCASDVNGMLKVVGVVLVSVSVCGKLGRKVSCCCCCATTYYPTLQWKRLHFGAMHNNDLPRRGYIMHPVRQLVSTAVMEVAAGCCASCLLCGWA